MATTTDAPTVPAAEQPASAIVKVDGGKAPVRYGDRGAMLSSFEDLFRFSTLVHQSQLAPKGLDSPQKIAVCVQYGAEFGLAPMASLRAVKVINGIPSFSGDAALALVMASGKLQDYGKEYVGADDAYGCRVTTLRVGAVRPDVTEFTVKDAKLAGLWGKSGPWSQYPKRMLYYRALGFNLRDNFADVLAGAVIAEEADDYPVGALAPGAVTAQLAARPAVVDTLMEKIGVTAPAPAVMPTPPPPVAEEPGAADAADLFEDGPKCDHPKVPPSKLKPGKTAACPDCGEELRG